MRTAWRCAAALAAVFACATIARAHELTCDKRVKLAGDEGPGTTLLRIGEYPAALTYTRTIFNVHPTDTSIVIGYSDTLLQPTPVEVELAIPVGESVSMTDAFTIESYEACLALATFQGEGGAVAVDNRFTAMWERGEAQCTARVVCLPLGPPEITCEKTVDGKALEEIRSYPATLHYAVTVENEGAASAVIQSAVDSFLGGLTPPFEFTPAPPFTLAPGASESDGYDLVIESYDACRALATSCWCGEASVAPTEGTCRDGCVALIENVFTVGWDERTATCSAGVRCYPQPPTPPQLACTKTIDGGESATVTAYPATVTYGVVIQNTGETAATVTGFSDPVVTIEFPQATPFEIAAGASASGTGTLTIGTFEECQELATSMVEGNAIVDNTFTFAWNGEQGWCTARLVCEPLPPSGATRTMGFFSTHIAAAEACLAGGPIDLGLDGTIGTVDTIAEFMSLLWTEPSEFTGLAKDRFLLARQTLVAVCNGRLFATTSPDVAAALAALQGCATNLEGLIEAVDLFNNSGDQVEFPAGFEPGPSTPQAAQAIAAGYTLTVPDLSCPE